MGKFDLIEVTTWASLTILTYKFSKSGVSVKPV
jgi:hypothetical protein